MEINVAFMAVCIYMRIYNVYNNIRNNNTLL